LNQCWKNIAQITDKSMSVINLENRNIYHFKPGNHDYHQNDRDGCEYTYERILKLDDNNKFGENSDVILNSMSAHKHGVIHFFFGNFIIDLDKVDVYKVKNWDLPVLTIKKAIRKVKIDKVLT